MMDKERIEEMKQKEEELLQDIEEFNREKERIKKLIGSIGGTSYSHRDTIINITFLAIILTLFILEITTHWLPPFISLEVSVLLVSVKIVWMIHSQHKYNHFVFWILNTIEYKVNETSKRMKTIENKLNRK